MFWKTWKSKFDNTTKCTEVDGLVDDQAIADKFASYFSKCYAANNSKRASELELEYAKMRQSYNGFLVPGDKVIDTELVSKVVMDLKRGKAPGLDGLAVEHITFAHPAVVLLLVKLFQLIVEQHYVPRGFCCNYIVPLPKCNDARSKALTCDDFRGIAISSIFSKIFEHCLLKLFSSFLYSADNQFGFKKGLGCNHAIFTSRKIIEQIVKDGGTANLCSIDLSKAFDKVNHCALFMKLMHRHVPLCFLELLENWFCNYVSTVKWGTTYSAFFSVNFGVRQGSVLSPFLFAIYLDNIACKGHFALRTFVVLYADDILLITQSVSELQRLLDKCELELAWLDMCINVSKSACLRIGPRHQVSCASLTTASGHALRWLAEIRYLGTYIVSNRNFRCNVSNSKRSFYRAANAIFGKIGNVASEDVILHLLYSKCIPVLIYGLESFVLNSSDKRSVDFVLQRFLMKLFHTSSQSVISECMSYFDIQLPSDLIAARAAKFVKKYSNGSNRLCRYFGSII